MNEDRRAVYPFCARCTTSSIAWCAPDAVRLTGIGSRFYGHRDSCESCGSSVRTLYSTFLWIPVARVGLFRIIPTGGRSYIGRKVVARPVQSVVRPAPVTDHPEFDKDPVYKQAEAYWRGSEPGQALPFYQSALIDREKVLAADDPATLRVRLRVAQGLLATANYGRAIAWFELVTPQLAEVFGPHHELTRAATEAVTGARLMVGGPRSEAKLLANIVAADEQDLDRFDPQLLRDRAALGRALLAIGEIADSIQALATAVADTFDALGASHPDARVYRSALEDACVVAAARGKKPDLLAAEAAQQLLNDASAPTNR